MPLWLVAYRGRGASPRNMRSSILYLTLIISSGLAAGCVSNSGSLASSAAPLGGAAVSAAPATSPQVHLVTTRVVTPRFGRGLHELPAIEVRVTNRGSEPFDFSTAKIEALADATPVKVYSVDEY